jgi:maltose O-acetyltransferase
MKKNNFVLKYLYWDLIEKNGRFSIIQFFLINIPNQFGSELRKIFYRKYFKKMGNDVYIFPDVRIRNPGLLSVGDNSRIGEKVMIQAAGQVEIGRNVLIGPDVKIWSANHNYKDHNIPIADQGYTLKKVSIADGCWLGANSFILPGVSLKEGTVVGACSVIFAEDYPPNVILGGYPARIVGHR